LSEDDGEEGVTSLSDTDRLSLMSDNCETRISHNTDTPIYLLVIKHMRERRDTFQKLLPQIGKMRKGPTSYGETGVTYKLGLHRGNTPSSVSTTQNSLFAMNT
jgi:hypothetical protein